MQDEPTRKYRLGSRVLDLGFSMLGSLDMREIAPCGPSPRRCSRSGEVVAAVNIAIPWSPVAMSELVAKHGPILQATARQITARVI